ncbi:uncharacterized protein LOC100370890 [Saccoglossus kowalevskii]|uniref:Uncharacterized protein LOC100370890 isoform X1 n=1 Tax=Saccoglossus kowalevskii TaxID=10224 RepID=A0ABM0GJS1_SACKO|nr:PREDICTED: uncharacterized protein LOC100370890 isoform X1 [Saccoglossus kowalevskii]XP_006812296.1 PREDICTED: uncharacterized protein LOC100370890 isoform X2 [Saccoglossus kowalevskii]
MEKHTENYRSIDNTTDVESVCICKLPNREGENTLNTNDVEYLYNAEGDQSNSIPKSAEHLQCACSDNSLKSKNSSDFHEAKIRINGKLEQLRSDLTSLQNQDQSLLRQLLHIHEMIGQLNGGRYKSRRFTVSSALGGARTEVDLQEIVDRLSPRRLRSLSFSSMDDFTEFDFDDDAIEKLSMSYPACF